MVDQFATKHDKHMKSVSLNDDGISFKWSSKKGLVQKRILWAEISEIKTCKVDCFSYNDICLAFRCGDEWFEVSEEDADFKSLMRELPNRFNISSDWYSKVMLPAFETNERRLWPR